MATYYLDNTASGTNNGSSWTNAWQSWDKMQADAVLNGDDFVEISGGATSQTYTTGEYLGRNGTSGHPITYRVSTEAGKNGQVIINGPTVAPFHWVYAQPPGQGNWNQWTVFSGEVDGTSHMTVTAGIAFDFAETQGLTVRYVNIHSANKGYDSDTVEFAYCDFYSDTSDGWGNFAALVGIGRNQGSISYPSGFTRNLIHHNTFHMRSVAASGDGDDGIQNIGNSSIYNNRFIGENGAYIGNQHGDGIQTKGPNLLIYNNYFEAIHNYGVFLEIFTSATVNTRIYNNTFYNNGSQNISILMNGTNININDVIVSNNTFVLCGWGMTGNPLTINTSGSGNTFTNIYAVNNLFYDATTTTDLHASVVASNNSNGTNTNIFLVNPASDFHLLAGSTAVIDQGISPSYLTSVYTTDKDNAVRNVGAWDIGAYEFGVGSAASPVVIGRILRWMEVAAFVTGMGWTV